MSDASAVISIAGSPPGEAVFSVVLFALFASCGWVTALNYRDAAYRLFDYFSRVVFVGPATPGTLRLVGAGIAFIGTVGLMVEVVDLFDGGR